MILVSRRLKVINTFTIYCGRHVGRFKVSEPVVCYEVMKIPYEYFRPKTNLINPTNPIDSKQYTMKLLSDYVDKFSEPQSS
jgi:hypothetical protein